MAAGTGVTQKKRKKVTLDVWVDQQLQEAMLWAGGGLVMGLFAASFLTLLYWNMIWLILVARFQWAIAPGWFAEVATGIFLLLGVIYYLVSWDSLQRLGTTQAFPFGHWTGLSFLSMGVPRVTFGHSFDLLSTAKIFLMFLLIGPSSWHLVFFAIQRMLLIRRANRERLTAAIKKLLESERRISASAALGVHSPLEMRIALAELSLFHGINFIEAPPAGLVMSDSLKDEIIASCKAGEKKSVERKSTT
jgi:hypothetical protein